MNTDEIKAHALRIVNNGTRDEQFSSSAGSLSEALEFLRIYAGSQSSFYKSLSAVSSSQRGRIVMDHIARQLVPIVKNSG